MTQLYCCGEIDLCKDVCTDWEWFSFSAQVQLMECLSFDGDTILDCLPIDGQAWKVQFDKMGSLLATSAVDGDDNNVCVWELNPDGQWYLLSKIVGEPAEVSAGAMLE